VWLDGCGVRGSHRRVISLHFSREEGLRYAVSFLCD
jgi:hypothetical protein